MNVVVVGGGWAGLTAAAELAAAGAEVTLLEAAPRLGGRARTVESTHWHGDNGQHLLLGAYTETLNVLQRLGADLDTLFMRMPLTLELRRPGETALRLRAPQLPAPLHLLAGLLTANGLTWHDRRAALALCLRLARCGFRLRHDLPLSQWLTAEGQTEALITALWEPLCLAALNTPMREASSAVFVRILGDSFAKRRSDSDLLLARPPLGDCLPHLAQEFIIHAGGRIHTGQSVRQVIVEGERVVGVRTNSATFLTSHVVLATPAWVTQTLLAPITATRPIADSLAQLQYYPICTVYLHYPADTRLDSPLLGMLGGMGQWLFDRRLNDEPGWMAVVISGPGEHMALDNRQLAARIEAELAALFPTWPAALDRRVIREKRATFACTAAAAALRPAARTALPGLYLAGDYTATGYPATLEGAVRSGCLAAQSLLATLSRGSAHETEKIVH